MKTLGQFSPLATPLAVAFSLIFASGSLQAFGPGGTGNTGVSSGAPAAGGANTGVAVSGGSRGGGAVTGNAVRSSAAPTVVGARPGVSFSNSAPRLSPGLSTRGVTGNNGVPVVSPQGARTTLPTTNSLQSAPRSPNSLQPVYRSPSRPANAWSGTAVNPADGRVARNPASRQTYNSNGYTNNRFPGQHLDPGAFGSNLTDNRSHQSNRYRGDRRWFPYRYYSYPYYYGPTYAPYIGYYGGYYGPYSYAADNTGLDTGNGYNGSATVTPQYVDQGQDASDDQPNPVPQTAPQNRSTSNANAQPTVPMNGPDSLVEAVQEELIRRGYFAGKVDAMFGPDTKEALRKFQQDHHLADSGLINEATLHALQLD